MAKLLDCACLFWRFWFNAVDATEQVTTLIRLPGIKSLTEY